MSVYMLFERVVFIFEKSEVNFHSASVPLHRLDVNVDCQVVKAHEDVM